MRLPAWLLVFLPAAAGAALAMGGLAASAATESVQIVSTGTNCTSAFCFVPSTTNSTSGDTVTWTNTTAAPHTVTPCNASACSGQGPGTGTDTWGSPGQLSTSGGTYQHAFSGPGTYFYYCQVHGYSVMHGEVIVASAPGTGTPETPATALLIVVGAAAIGGGGALVVRRRIARDSGR